MATKEEIIAQKTIATECYILSTLPVFYAPLYRLDGSPFISADGHGHSCTVSGATWGSQGRTFAGVGSGDKITIPDAPSLDITAAITFGCWFKATIPFASFDMVISKGPTDYEIYGLQGDDEIRFTCTIGAGTDNLDTVNANLVNNTWYMVTVTYDGTTRSIYINGVPNIADGTVNGALGTSANNLLLGERDGANLILTGTIGEVLIYNRALTPLGVQQNYIMTAWRYR